MVRRTSVVALALLSSGCLYSRAALVPMPMTIHAAPAPAQRVVVFLPGLGDDPEKFVEHGFVARVNAMGWDAVTTDAHFGYYRERNLAERLETDVIAQLRARGYREIKLIGISLGGFGSVIYSVEHTPEISGMLLLSPFLGQEGDWRPIEQAGGLRAWAPGDPSAIEDRDERALHEVWSWLRGYATVADRPPLYLGFGASDRFVRPDRLLAAVLPQDRVAVVPGGHRWSTWEKVFDRLLPRFLGEGRHARRSEVEIRRRPVHVHPCGLAADRDRCVLVPRRCHGLAVLLERSARSPGGVARRAHRCARVLLRARPGDRGRGRGAAARLVADTLTSRATR